MENITISASLSDAPYPISSMIMKVITSGISLVYKLLFEQLHILIHKC